MQKKLIVTSGCSLLIVTFNIAVNEIHAKKSVRCNRTRCKREPVYSGKIGLDRTEGDVDQRSAESEEVIK